MSQAEDDNGVFRKAIDAHRDTYYVRYQPADARYSFALLQLTFLDAQPDVDAVRLTVEQELAYWLKRYPVPAMASAYDTKEDLIHVFLDTRSSLLMGFVDAQSGETVCKWGGYEDDELPSVQFEAEYQNGVYGDLPSRLKSEVRQEAYRQVRRTGRGIRIAVFLLVGVPVLIELLSLGLDWLGYLLSAVSISLGLYKLGKTMGWWKPTARALEEAEKERKMKHYYYHCELNPDGFNRLKADNFEREAILRTHEESLRLRTSSSGRN